MTPGQPSPRASWPSADDDGAFYLVITLLCCGVLGYFGWTTYHTQISAAVMALRHHEIGLLRYFTHRFDLADRQMLTADPSRVTLHDLYFISRAVGMAVRISAAGLILALAGLCAWRAAPSRYRRQFNLDRLIREHCRSFPTTSAFARRHLRLVAPSDDLRPADLALSPREWIARYGRDEAKNFDAEKARQELVLQLGSLWHGVETASPVVRCLFAAFALHLAVCRREAQQLLGDASTALRSTWHDDPDGPGGPAKPLILPHSVVSRADAILRDHNLRNAALAVTAGHAYTNTAMMTLLIEARRAAGVLAPAQFAWLKLVDRSLWYALHSLGFETDGADRYQHPNPRPEAMGARDHWAAERLAGVPIIKPGIERALEVLGRAARLLPVKKAGSR